MVTRDLGDAPGPSPFNFHTNKFASRVVRHVKVAVAAEGYPVELGTTALSRRKAGILREYIERRGAGRELEDGGICAVGDVYGPLRVHSDVIAERVRPRQ